MPYLQGVSLMSCVNEHILILNNSASAAVKTDMTIRWFVSANRFDEVREEHSRL